MPPRKNTAKKSSQNSIRKTAMKPIRDFSRPEYFFNRELSWLEFNQRVLEEAQDETNPLLERLKFLTIVSSNLDEFFEIRVAGLQQRAESNPAKAGPDGLEAAQTLQLIGTRTQKLIADQYRCYGELLAQLAAEGILLTTIGELSQAGQNWCENYFENEVFPVLTPLAIDPSHPFPQLLNKSLNLAVILHIPDTPGQMDGLRADERHQSERFGVVQVPRVLPRLVALPAEICRQNKGQSEPENCRTFVFLSSIISNFIDRLFPGLEVQGCYAFRVTRNSELYLDEDEADNLLDAVREQLQQRRRGAAVRLEVQKGCDPTVVQMLLKTFELQPQDLYEVDGPVNLTRLMAVYSAAHRSDLKDAPYKPSTPAPLEGIESSDEFFDAIRERDILLHHPYESFQSVIEFITRAANCPRVLAIKMTLYRASEDSPIIKALMRAAENGKQVTAVVELKARFDEENNIQWARAMEEAGVHVLYGLVGLKTHSKLTMVVRREGEKIRRYMHLGTGNYNEVTARLYTDIAMLTARSELGEDAAKIFNLLTGMSQFPGLEKLHMAPFGLHEFFIAQIEREISHAKKMRRAVQKSKTKNQRPKIIAKMNALEEPEIIKALYRASAAGVQIDLIVRGICCLKPGVPGLSENIRVRSIVDRFLEHSRLFYFENGGDSQLYCGSADWMPRNFFRRVEVMFPVEDANLKKHLRDDVLLLALKDNVKARLLQKDGVYRRARKNAKTKPVRLQQVLMEKHSASHSEMPVGEIPVLEARPAAAPGSTPGVMLRAAPDLAPPAADGRAGTSADPILLSLRETLREQDENTPLENTPLENTPLESEAQNSEENADNIKLRLKKKARER
jgi:polyphosphate kinase